MGAIEISSLVFVVLVTGVCSLALGYIYLQVAGKSVFSKEDIRIKEQLIQDLKTSLAIAESAELVRNRAEVDLIIEHKSLSGELTHVKTELEREKTTRELLAIQLGEAKQMLDRVHQEQDLNRIKFQNLQLEYGKLTAQLRESLEKYDLQKKDIEQIGEKFELSFRHLATNILEERTKKFDEHQQTSLKHILDPLQKDMDGFKKDFSDKFIKESEDRIGLREQVKNMIEMSSKLSDQANNLTQALRGQAKQQGNWGEAILESILQYAGLQKDIQYFVQESVHNEQGNRVQPDIRVQFPGDRHVIIDSKVSLLHYEQYCNATEPADQHKFTGQLLSSMKNHIGDLSQKNYQDQRTNTLDFVMMFIPVEAAYITALQAEPSLWQFAYKRRILLISPTNLIAAMKLVADFWQRDQSHKNSEKIALRASGIYDKLVGFMETFEKMGEAINKASQSFDQAKNQLSKGKGNLLSKAESMKQLNLKTTKSLPRALITHSLLDEGEHEDLDEEIDEKVDDKIK